MHRKNLLLVLTAIFLSFITSLIKPQQQNSVQKLYSEFQNAMKGGDTKLLSGIEKKCAELLHEKGLTAKQLAMIYTVKGGVEISVFRLNEALTDLTRALQLCEKEYGKTSLEALEAKKYLSWTYGYMNNLELERRYSFELLDYYKKDEKKYAVEIADLYHTIGMNYGLAAKNGSGDRITEQRYYDLGRKTLEGYQPQKEANEAAKQSGLMNIYNSLGVSYCTTDNYDNSLYYARKSLALRQKLTPNSAERAVNWMVIGRSLFQTEGNPDSALYYLTQAINLLEHEKMKGTPPWASYKSYKADILIKASRLDDAITETQSAIDYMEQSGLLNPASAGSLIQNYSSLARAYIEKGDYKKALKLCKAASAAAEKAGGVTSITNVILKAQYATTLGFNKEWDKAGREFDSAILKTGITTAQLKEPSYTLPATVPFEFLNVYRQAGNHFIQYGFANNDKQNTLSGIRILRKVAQGLEHRKTWYFEAGIDEGIGTQDLNIHDDLLKALYEAEGVMPDKERMTVAFEAIETPKATLLKNKLLEEKRLIAMLPDMVDRERLELKVKVYEALNQVRQTGDAANQDSLVLRKEAYMNFLREIKKRYPIAETKEKEAMTVTDTLLTHHKGVIINYFLGAKYLYAFVHENGRQKFIQKPIPANFINDLAFVRKNCLTKESRSDSGKAEKLTVLSRQWYQWLLNDVDTAGELVIIPHRQLSLISFEMLDADISGVQTNYVIEKRPVRYELSASLMHLADRPQTSKNLSFFGGFASSKFDTIPGKKITSNELLTEAERGSIETLVGTAREVEQISEITKGNAFMHVQPNIFLKNADKYRVLHVAAHAFADQGVNHGCKLLFETDSSGNNIVSDVGVASLKINADMTVLSACNTGLGKINNSEGMLSLGRSFFIAGCPSVVMSLWTVNDASTAKIMTAFYRHLQEGQTKAEALRNAKLDYLKTETNPARKHPYYWAGFIVVGDNTPVSDISRRPFKKIWLLMALAVTGIAAAGIYLRRRSKKSLA